MKMSVGTRVLLSLFLIVILLICGVIIAASFGAFAAQDIWALASGFTDTGYKYIWAAAALLMAVIAIVLLFFRSKKEAPANAVMLDASGDGSVAVTTEALKELVNNYLKNVSEIVIQRVEILSLGYRALRLNLAISVRQEVQVPELTKKISEEIKTYIATYSGITAEQVYIKVLPMKPVQ